MSRHFKSITYFLALLVTTPGVGAPKKKKVKESTLADIFESKCGSPLNISFFGDLYVEKGRVKKPETIFDDVKHLLQWGDYNVANFEGVATDLTTRAFPDYPFALRMEKDFPTVVSRAGIKYLTLANNHSMDFGYAGLKESIDELEKADISTTGAGSNLKVASIPLTLLGYDIRVAIFAMTTTYPLEAWATDSKPGVAFASLERIKELIKDAQQNHDFVIMTFHWGEESSLLAKPHQHELGTYALKNGADLVIGHHPHVAQEVTFVDGKPLIFSLGNFVFTSVSDLTELGFAAQVELCKENDIKKLRLALTPLNTQNKITQYKTRPYSLKEFKKSIGPYLKNKLIPAETLFFIPNENKAKTLAGWKITP